MRAFLTACFAIIVIGTGGYFFLDFNAKAQWGCVLHRGRANNSAVVLAFRIPPGRDWRFGSSDGQECSRCARRMG